MRRFAMVPLAGLLSAAMGCATAITTDSVAPGGGGAGGEGGAGSSSSSGSGGSGGGPIDPTERCAGVDCSALNAPCVVGQCDPADGTCKAAPIAGNPRCDDGDRCTTGDACAAGTCAGTPADCSALDDGCHVGTCNPANGTCSAVAVPDGTLCNDGDACTASDACAAGSCSGAAAVDCSALDGTCSVGACNPADGTCRATPVMTGTSCDDGNLCSWSDACSMAACTGSIIDCDPLGVSFPHASDTPVRGSSADGDFLDDCPFGQVQIGIQVNTAAGPSTGLLTEVATLCGAVSVTPAGAGAMIAVSPGARVPETGARGSAAATGGSTSVLCPANQAVVGVAGSAETASGRISQVTLRCAPLAATGTASSGYGISMGAATALPPFGEAGTTAIPATDCPSGTVARGAHLRAGEVLNGYGLRCGTPTMRLVTTIPRVASPGGTAYEDDCPEGQVPIGIEARVATGFYSGTLANLVTQCGTVAVTRNSTGFDATVSPGGARLPATGSRGTWTYVGSLLTATCPANQAVVGLAGSSGGSPPPNQYTTQLNLRCAPFTVSGDATAGYTASVGTITQLPPVGTTTGTASPAVDCPPGMLGRGLYVNAGDIADGVALRCAAPQLNPH